MIQLGRDSMKHFMVQWALWIAGLILIALVISINIFFSQYPLLYRVIAMLLLFLLAIGVLSLTAQGNRAIDLFKGARFELKKVSWPTRIEIFQTALVVVIVVVLSALLIWLFDNIFIVVIRWILS